MSNESRLSSEKSERCEAPYTESDLAKAPRGKRGSESSYLPADARRTSSRATDRIFVALSIGLCAGLACVACQEFGCG